MAKIALHIEDQPVIEINLDIDDGDINRIQEQVRRLRDHGIHLSDRAHLFSILAVEAIASEPARDWPSPLNEKHSRDSDELRSRFIDALGYNLFTQARDLSKAGEHTDIQIFDAIRRGAELSLECRRIIRVPLQ